MTTAVAIEEGAAPYTLKTNRRNLNFSQGFGLTHYLGCFGAYGDVGPGLDVELEDGNVYDATKNLAGVFGVRSKTKLGQVTDGTSNTIMFGEAPGSIGAGFIDDVISGQGGSGSGDEKTAGFSTGYMWIGANLLPAYLGLDLSREQDLAGNDTNPQYDTKWSYFGSLHPSVAQFCFVDGSVQTLSTDVDTITFRSLSTMRAGEIIDETEL